MNFSVLCKQLNIKLGTDIKTAIDIGCGSGGFSNALSNFLYDSGIAVTAIDKEKPTDLHTDIPFTQIRFEDFKAETFYDLVHCRNVLPFMENKLEQLERMLKMGKYVFFTAFGPHDEWKETALSKEEILSVLAEKTILYFSEEEYRGAIKAGTMKQWHIYTFFVKTI